MTAVEPLPVPGLQLVRPAPGVARQAAIEALEDSPDVLYAEPDAIRRPLALPDDRYLGHLWGHHNMGQVVDGRAGRVDVDVDAPEAWDLTTGSAGVTVAVVDTGIDTTHPDLAPNAWSNPAERVNGVDDDGNGLVDDIRGWDFVDDDTDPADTDGHGTHVAGTIGARGNDGVGVAGVSWRTTLLPLRVIGPDGGTVSDVIAGYRYAGRRGIRVVNASLGGATFSRAERDAIAAAPDTLFVVAAGNDAADNDRVPSYPCGHDLPNVLCVAAIDAAPARRLTPSRARTLRLRVRATDPAGNTRSVIRLLALRSG